VLEVHLDLGGYPVVVADTAGLRETTDKVEAEGVRRALARSEAADAVLLLLDAAAPDSRLPDLPQEPALIVWNKADVGVPPLGSLAISVRTGAGLERLLTAVGNIVRERFDPANAPVLTRERHRHALIQGAEALERSMAAVAPEIMAEEIRLAMRELGRITGRVDVEDLLDVVFRDFCIGK
jgi:tRNA modification GTPase